METEIGVKGVSAAEVDRVLSEIWASAAFRKHLDAQGVKTDEFQYRPISARPAGEQNEIAQTIMIAVASGLATHIAKLIFDAAYTELKRRLGARVRDPEDR